MNVSSSRKYTARKVLLAFLITFELLGVCVVNLEAQAVVKDKDDKPAVDHRKDRIPRRESLKVSGYTRPGNPSDLMKDGELIRLAEFVGELKKFKVMGATVYFAVFKNTHIFDDTSIVEGDTFGTGFALDSKFEPGRSFRDASSPRFDPKAKYLYLYQVVNDRSLDPRLTTVKGEKGSGISWPVFDPKKFDPKAEVPVTDDIARFALKLIVDPRYLTSWGHFHDAGFAANVVDEDVAGNPVKNIVADGKKKIEAHKDIRLAFSYLPAIVTKLPGPAFNRRARSLSLGELENGFGVDKAGINLKESKAFGDLSNVAGKVGADNAKFAGFVDGLVKAAGPAMEPDFVQLIDGVEEQRSGVSADDAPRAIFRVDWSKGNTLKQGYRSAVFGFTTDLAPTSAPIRIDTPDGVKAREGVRFADYFIEDDGPGGAGQAAAMAMIFATLVDNGNAQDFVQVQNAMARVLGSALGQAATPIPPPPAPAGGGAFTGGFGSGFGGSPSSGGSGIGSGFGTPWLNGAIPTQGTGFGGGGFGGGFGNGNGQAPNETQAQQGAQAGTITINFNATLTKQQAQQQHQKQFQSQHHTQNNNNRGHHHPNPTAHGPVVPAPASLLLGLLGLPALLLIRRRKNAEALAAAHSVLRLGGPKRVLECLRRP